MTKLINLTAETAAKAASLIGGGVKSVEAARISLLLKVGEACDLIGQPMSAAQYDKQLAPHIAATFAKLAKSKGSSIKESTLAQYRGKLKTAVLARLNGVATPIAGESFWDFYDRAAKLLPAAKLPDGSPVWEASTKKGRKAGFKAPAKPGSVKPAAVLAADQAGATPLSEEAQGSAKLAAARILANGNDARARRLVLALANYGEEFDRWMSSVLEEAAKTVKATAQPKAPAPIVLKDGEPATALGAALVKAESAKTSKARKAA